MDAENRRSDALTRLIRVLRERSGAIARDVAADLGPGASAEAAEPVVDRFLGAIAAGAARVGEADLVRLRAEGAAAAREGTPLATPIDAYLSTAWVAWDHALGVMGEADPVLLGALGAALLRAGDDIAAALADGYTAAERALATSAGATRQAILAELLEPASGDPAGIARLVHRVELVGFDPGSSYQLLVIRPGGRPGPAAAVAAGMVEELGRRLARDPARRPHLVSSRGADVVAITSVAAREGGPFGDHVAGLAPGEPWWAVTSAPVPIDGVAPAYLDAVDALRVVPIVASSGHIIPVADLALERALVADPGLATLGAARWLDPLEAAGRGASALVTTLETWLAAGESVVAAARILGVAPRTVSYRLARVAAALGVPALDPDIRARLSTALLVRRLLGAPPDSTDRVGSLGSAP